MHGSDINICVREIRAHAHIDDADDARDCRRNTERMRSDNGADDAGDLCRAM